MFAMRYKPDHCGGLALDSFIELVQAEGAPIYRAFAATMSDQPAMQHLMRKRPDYFRRLPTPIADQAAEDTVYIAQNVFLGTADDMEDIVAAIRKVGGALLTTRASRARPQSRVNMPIIGCGSVTLMAPSPALAAALRATTLEVVRTASAYDALVIGAGATGGLAALLLPRRACAYWCSTPVSPLPVRSVSASSNSRGSFAAFWARRCQSLRRRQAIQSRCYAWRTAPEAFVDDIDCPYITPPDRPFVWLRARQLGGRMVVPGHGRQYYRLGPNDFAPVDGLSPPWPLLTAELDPWYALVERRLGLAGTRDNVPWLPDSELSYVLSETPAEASLRRSIVARWPGARPVLGRFAAAVRCARSCRPDRAPANSKGCDRAGD